jgi:hypothetical protein
VLAPGSVVAQTVATCSESNGYAHYHNRPPVAKKDSGFQKDAISGGLVSLKRLDDGSYDILVVDARAQVFSYRRDGGEVILVRRGTTDATFLVLFPKMVVEIYTFYVDANGVQRFDLLQSKGGDGMPIHKSSLMTGRCSSIDLPAIR